MRESVRGWNAAALRTARHEAGLTQEDLAGAAGCAPSAVGTWESGRYGPQPRYALALATALGIPVSSLVDVDPAEATIRDLRTWAGLTQTEVRAEAPLREVGAIERGTRALPQDKVASLAALYGVDEDDIIAAAARSREAWRRRLDARRPRGE